MSVAESAGAFASSREAERKESSVKMFERQQLEELKAESRLRQQAEAKEIQKVKKEMDSQLKIVDNAEREERERNRIRELAEKKKAEKSLSKQLNKEVKQERKLRRLQETERKIQERRYERKIRKGVQEERALKDHGRGLGKALGFHDGILIRRKGKLTSREKLERQIRQTENKLERLRNKLMGL